MKTSEESKSQNQNDEAGNIKFTTLDVWGRGVSLSEFDLVLAGPITHTCRPILGLGLESNSFKSLDR